MIIDFLKISNVKDSVQYIVKMGIMNNYLREYISFYIILYYIILVQYS